MVLIALGFHAGTYCDMLRHCLPQQAAEAFRELAPA